MELLITGPAAARHTLVLAHGAGQAMDADAMELLAGALAQAGVRVVRFEFPYMQRRRATGRAGGPDRQPVLEETWRAVIAQVAADHTGDGAAGLAIGGRSMGGRIASLVADECGVAAWCASPTRSIPPAAPTSCAPRTWRSCARRRDPAGRARPLRHP